MSKSEVQPETAAITAQQLFSIEALKYRKKTPESIYCGVCASKEWRLGREVTEEEYDKAVENFLHGLVGKKDKKC